MGKQLDIQGMSDRIAAALTFDETIAKTGVRLEALRPLHYLFAAQQKSADPYTPDSARYLIEEAHLFIEAAHSCYNRLGTPARV